MSLSALHHALRAKDADRAWAISCSLPHVPLRYAARLVALLADTPERRERYRVAADRLLIRVIEEVKPDPVQTKKLADVLAHVHHYYWQHVARMALGDVVGQLHERERRLSLSFDSEGQRPSLR